MKTNPCGRTITVLHILPSTIGNNSKEMYGRHGNKSPHGTKLDDMQVLTIHTFKNGYRMGKHYGVNSSTTNRILKGEAHRHIFKALYE